MAQRIKLLIVDDHPTFRAGLRAMLDAAPQFEVLGEAASVAETVELHRELSPDVTLLDLNLKGGNGIDAISQILATHPTAKTIVLSTFDLSEDIHQAYKAGARAYLLKDASRSEIIEAIETVHQGGRVVPPLIEQRLQEKRARPDLTPKELEILQWVVQGLRNKEIAAKLNIAEFTVKGHLKTIFLKLQVSDRTEAAIKAVSEGLVHLRN